MKRLIPILMVALLATTACTETTTSTPAGGDSTNVAKVDSMPKAVVDSTADDSMATAATDSGKSEVATTDPAKDPKDENVRKSGTDPIATATRLTVSFISIGSGIDHKAKDKFTKFVSGFETANKVKLVTETVGWGREGEVDYCYDLASLKPAVRAAFVGEAKKQVSGNELVHVKENTPCRKPR